MQNVISLQERRIKKDIEKACNDLKEVRTSISYGQYERVQEAIDLETTIAILENQLIELIETNSF